MSRIIESYLQTLTAEEKSDDFEISEFVKSISTEIKIPNDYDYKKDYTDYLMKKYK